MSERVLGTWAAPPDFAAAAALVMASLLCAVALLPGARRAVLAWLSSVSGPRFLTGAAAASALLSFGYVAHYLRGGPRIVDASMYMLEARSLAQGHFSFPALWPSASVRGRFLLYDEEHGALAGLFPPGYPLLLSLGVRLGAPLAVGPILAALLVVATHRLATEIAESEPPEQRLLAARVAALLSVLSAALRYHTADTMSHGAAALLTTTALASALALRRSGALRHGALLGLALGGLVATRPVSSIAPALVAAGLLACARPPLRALAVASLGALPGIALLLAWQRAVTGSYLGSPQLLYYATSDGPPGCFRYGFGQGIGCIFEHGTFVQANLPGGYGPLQALATTGRRMKLHLADAANLELLLPLALAPLLRVRPPRAPLLAAGALLLLHVLAYAPFYFDGNYPGGGARLFAELLPTEHALLGLAIVTLGTPERAELRIFGLLAASLAGFALHASHGHVALSTRDGGVPPFEPEVLSLGRVEGGLVFVESDSGFALGHAPSADPRRRPLVVRRRGDDHDWLVFVGQGRPASYLYRHHPGGAAVLPWTPPAPDEDRYRFEAENDWPPLAQENGYALPTWASGTCASGGRVLTLTPTAGRAKARLELPVPGPGLWRILPRTLGAGNGAEGALSLQTRDGAELARWALEDLAPGCRDLPPRPLWLPHGAVILILETERAPTSLDRVLLDKER